MALAPTRIAAFEFLIQFRSAGRGSLRNAMRSFQNYSRQVQSTARVAIPNATIAARNYRLELERTGVSAAKAALLSQRYYAQVARQAAAARRQQSRAGILTRRRGITATSNAFPVRAARQLGFSQTTQANIARGLFRMRQGFQGVTRAAAGFARVLGPIGAGLAAIVSIGAGALGLFFKIARILGVVTGLLALTGAGLAALADEYTNLSNRIRVASDGSETVATTMFKLARIANEARAPLSDVAELFGRVAINAKEFGISQDEILRVVSVTSKAFRIGGSNAREASQAAIQFAQALGSNRLSGDELRAVREQALELSQIIARGLGVGVGDLKRLGEEGKLTTKAVVDAILSQERITDIRFGRTEATFSDGVTNIVSSLKFFASSVLSAVGLGPRFFNFVDGVAERFIKISENSGDLSVALSNLPRFFRELGLVGTGKFLNLLESIGKFFQNLPDNIQKTARQLNQFIGLLDNGLSTEDAARAAFGLTPEQIQNNTFIRGIDTFANLFTTVLPQFAEALTILTNAIITAAGVINALFQAPALANSARASSLNIGFLGRF